MASAENDPVPDPSKPSTSYPRIDPMNVVEMPKIFLPVPFLFFPDQFDVA
jgi:hypothetical protein